jgi:hypothetical protein
MMVVVTEDTASSGAEIRGRARLNRNDGQLSASRQLTLATILAAYCTVVMVGVTHHEPWADEAQAWLLSRDLSYRYLVLHQLAYEGHPPLWPTILWVASHWFHLPYQSMNWIGGLCAIAGCWFFCRYSPFPLFVRVLFPFTYFMAFQYAIVARPYVLLPLFAFATAHFFTDAERRPWRFAAAASALTLLTAPGVMIAVGLMAARAWYIFRSWAGIPPPARRQLIAAAVMFGIVLAFVAFVNWPPADRSNGRRIRSPDETTVGLAFLPRDISVAFLGSPILSTAFLVAVGAWCACRQRLLPFALPTALVLALFVKVYGNLWHCGALTLICVTALWIGWPLQARCVSKLSWVLNSLMLVGLAGLFAVNVYWTARTLAMDYSGAYSGSSDAANFLRSVRADANSTCGFGFHSVAVQPYFTESIFQNWPHSESFWRFEIGNHVNDTCNRARWAVLPICCTFDTARQVFYRQDRSLRLYGYVPVHVSKGSMFFEGREAEPTDFVIYELSE